MSAQKRQHSFPDQPKCPRPTFDIFMVEECFPATKPATESDTQLLTAILKRNSDLTPTLEEQTQITALVSQVQNVLETISLDPQSASLFDEFRVVGSYKMGTTLRGRNEADVVLILRQSPTTESVTQISDRVREELSKTNPGSSFAVTVMDYGFCVSPESVGACVKILITTQIGSMRKKADGQQCIPVNLQHKHMAAIRHVRWFEDSVTAAGYKVLIRVIKDIVQRFPGLNVLNKWSIAVLSHYSISFLRTDATLPLNQALKRLFQLLAGGLFLPGAAGIPDPCEKGTVALHSSMTQKQQDRLCMTAQTIVRILSLTNGYEVILGLVPDEAGILEKGLEYNGVIIRPHAPVIGTVELESIQEPESIQESEYQQGPESYQEPPVSSDPMETSAPQVKEEEQQHNGDTCRSITIFSHDSPQK